MLSELLFDGSESESVSFSLSASVVLPSSEVLSSVLFSSSLLSVVFSSSKP